MATSPSPASPAPSSPIRRECFVTIGATATFTSLLTTALSLPFLRTLSSLSYTHLILQCGDDLEKAQGLIEKLQPELQRLGLEVAAFGFNKEGLGREMRGCKGSESRRGGHRLVGLREEKEVERREGVCVCHAGMCPCVDTNYSSSAHAAWSILIRGRARLTYRSRRRNYPRCSPPLDPHHCRPEPLSPRQPPARTRRRACATRLRRSWKTR